MPTAITMPKLGMTMEEGTVIEWRARPGQTVEKGKTLVVVESEKSEIDLDAPHAGVLRHIYIEAGKVVPCGTFLGAMTDTAGEEFDAETFRRAGEAVTTPRPPSRQGGADSGPASAAQPRTDALADSDTGPARVTAATPAARKLCRELGLDPAGVPGSGPGGRVTREDVEAYGQRMASRVEVESGVYIDVQSTGDGPAVCLLPGFGTDASAFARQTPALSANYRVLSVNPRGIGFSDPPAPGYDLSRAVADVAAVLQEPSHLVGASLGAVVALRTAIDHPDKVRSLTLITPFLDVEDRLSVIVELWCELAAAGDHMTLALALAPWMFSATFLNDATRRGRAVSAIAQMARLIPTETLVRTRDLLGAMKTPSDDELASLPMPILVVIAGADMLTPDGESVAARFTKARVERIEGAGHAAALECPEQVNRLLLEHLGSDGRARAG